MSTIRRCRDEDRESILAIINAAAEAYRGAIPPDRWHEPYMAEDEVDREMAAAIEFWGYAEDEILIGVMGLQAVREVDLIRHAYVVPGSQRRGVGGALLGHLRRLSARQQPGCATCASSPGISAKSGSRRRSTPSSAGSC